MAQYAFGLRRPLLRPTALLARFRRALAAPLVACPSSAACRSYGFFGEKSFTSDNISLPLKIALPSSGNQDGFSPSNVSLTELLFFFVSETLIVKRFELNDSSATCASTFVPIP